MTVEMTVLAVELMMFVGGHDTLLMLVSSTGLWLLNYSWGTLCQLLVL